VSSDKAAVTPEAFWQAMKTRDLRFFAGVPCSLLANILNHALKDNEILYVPAVREDVALGLASSAYFLGRIGGVLMQNSGIGNIVNPLTSFNLVYKIPALLVITWRGCQGKDAPEHLVMGGKTTAFLDLMEIPYTILKEDNLEDSLDSLIQSMHSKRIPTALLIRREVIDETF